MIHAVSDVGPWIEMQDIRVIQVMDQGDADDDEYLPWQEVRVIFSDGTHIEFVKNAGDIKDLVSAWMRSQNPDEDQPTRRTL